MILESVKSPADVKKMDVATLENLAAEIRTVLIKKFPLEVATLPRTWAS